jgi:hypothetical protein
LLYWWQGHHRAAAENFQQCLALGRQADSAFPQSIGLHGLGLVHWRQGRLPSAAEQFQRAIDLCQRADEPYSQAYALYGLASRLQ